MTARATSSFTTKLTDILALMKPRITIMTMVVALGSMALAPVHITVVQALLSLMGIACLVSGSSAFNMYLERDVDPLMARTRNRPLAAGRLEASWGLFLGYSLSLLSVPLLLVGANLLTLMLGLFSLVVYVLVYTPMKRVSAYALIVGSIPGAMPALMGYTAAAGKIDLAGLSLFGILFIWQIPHFIAITIYRADEYRRAGFPVAAKALGLEGARLSIVVTIWMLVILSLSIWGLRIGGVFYLISATCLGLWFVFVALQGFYAKNLNKWAKQVFHTSLGYECLLFAALFVDVSFHHWWQ